MSKVLSVIVSGVMGFADPFIPPGEKVSGYRAAASVGQVRHAKALFFSYMPFRS